MVLLYKQHLKRPARNLRNGMTDAERLLWSKIKGRQVSGTRWYRQKPLKDFILDFYCHEAKLVIEVDGGQHFEEEGRLADKDRDEEIAHLGFQVLRFGNNEIFKNIEGVLMMVGTEIQKSLPTSLLKREE